MFGKRLVFPGLDLYTRSRHRLLPQFFKNGPISTLDAGCGNGALSYAAYRKGNHVTGISNDKNQIDKNRLFFQWLNTDSYRLQFKHLDLYNLPSLETRFDQIFCFEVLEHLLNDRMVLTHLFNCLNEGGMLHTCVPNSLHPKHTHIVPSKIENGDHVRPGYTFESLRLLLESVGFKVVDVVGIGSSILTRLDKPIRWVRVKYGELSAVPLFFLTLPFNSLDYINPKMPFSIYCLSVK